QSFVLRALRPLLLMTIFAAFATAQFETATLTGIITDPARAVVSGASVKVVNEATNFEATSTADSEGRYLFPSLRPGTYRITVTASGFKQSVSNDVVLQVNQAGRLDFQLTVGAVTEQITVSEEVPILETESSSRGSVIDQAKIAELPLNGRDYNQLAL